MSRAPKSPPSFAPGDSVRRRGLGHKGVVYDLCPLGVKVHWEEGLKPRERPMICSPFELEHLPDETGQP